MVFIFWFKPANPVYFIIILAMQAGDTVSVYADIKGTCLKGRIDSFTEQRMYVGNGIAKFSRADIFQSSEPLR